MKVLTVIPQSVEEIGDTNVQYSNLQDRRPEVRMQDKAIIFIFTLCRCVD
jgi:hypothetical protein